MPAAPKKDLAVFILPPAVQVEPSYSKVSAASGLVPANPNPAV